jgi:hypothetical protein
MLQKYDFLTFANSPVFCNVISCETYSYPTQS